MMELTMADITIRPAEKSEAMTLSNITWRSKGYWGYDEEFLRDCGELLNIKSSFIEKATVYVADIENNVGGFYGLLIDNNKCEMAYLQVAPEFIGKGLGRLLWNHALQQAKSKGWPSFTIHSDPYAVPFFTHMGAVKVDERQSRVRTNRLIPILEYSF